MTGSINPQVDTLWVVAYGSADASTDQTSKSKNVTADKIIKNNQKKLCDAKICLVVSSAILVVAVTFALAYSFLPTLASGASTPAVVGWSEFFAAGAAIFTVKNGFGVRFYQKCVEEDKTKSLIEIEDRLGEDLIKIGDLFNGNAFRKAEYQAGYNEIFQAVMRFKNPETEIPDK